MGSIERRIKELERLSPHGITVLACNLKTGEQREMPLRELIERFGEWKLEKVLSGNNLDEFDAYLEALKKAVKGGDLNDSARG